MSSSIFIFWSSTGISLHDLQLKTPYLSYTGPLCSPSVQPLSETGRFSSCLFKAPLLMSPLCSDWSASGSFLRLRRLRKQTIVAGFHFFFSFFTPNVNFSNPSVHVGAESHLKYESGQHMETPQQPPQQPRLQNGRPFMGMHDEPTSARQRGRKNRRK